MAWWWRRCSLLVERWIGVRLGGGGWARATTMLLSSSEEELPELSLLSSSSLSVRPSVPVLVGIGGEGIFL